MNPLAIPKLQWYNVLMQLQIIKDRCVYILRNGKEVVYVGKSNGGLYSRIGEHMRRKIFDNVELIICDTEDELARVEAREIIKHKPKGNNRIEKNGEYLTKQDIKKLYPKIHFSYITKVIKEKNIKILNLNNKTVYYNKEILDHIKNIKTRREK